MSLALENTLMQIYDSPRMMQAGGLVEPMPQPPMPMMQAPSAGPDDDLRQVLEALMQERMKADDPDDQAVLDRLINSAEVGMNAPLGQEAILLAQAGREGDSGLAHVAPGDVIIPPQAFEGDDDLEQAIAKRFKEMGIDPASRVAGVGIASLNPTTGLEEFFFKKIGKALKSVGSAVAKVAKPVAAVAQFIPGPWQPVAALANKAFTVADVVKGKASPLSLLTVAGPTAAGGTIGQNLAQIGKQGGVLSSLGQTVGAARSGIGSLFSTPGQALFGGPSGGGLPGLLRSASYSGQPVAAAPAAAGATSAPAAGAPAAGAPAAAAAGTPAGSTGVLGLLQGLFGGAPAAAPAGGGAGTYTIQTGDSLQSIAQQLGVSVADLTAANPGLAGTALIQGRVINIPGAAPAGAAAPGQQPGLGNLLSAILQGTGNVVTGGAQALGLPVGGAAQPGGAGGLASLLGLGGGQGGGGFLGSLGPLAMAGIPAYLLGKAAMEEAKSSRGVPLTPLTQEGAVGRYNIEAEVRRRMGEAPPDPVEFGLLPAGTLPQLSGGRPEEPRQMMMGGPVMAYRNGGEVSRFSEGGGVEISITDDEIEIEEEFPRRNGDINGEGTEVSDDIPAMLSDGEFVMTGRAVRGAGSFDMNVGNGGIITLTPSAEESRERGVDVLYQMMDLFSNYAAAPKTA